MTGAGERTAPVQGYAAGIPWSLHLRAYDVYCKRYGKQQALIEGSCRGGFGVGELDMFVPGWRDEVSEIGRLKAELAAARAREEAKDRLLGIAREVAKTALCVLANQPRTNITCAAIKDLDIAADGCRDLIEALKTATRTAEATDHG